MSLLRFEEYVVLNWQAWDDIGNGYGFASCTINPDFWKDNQEDLKEIYAIQEIHNELPYVSFSFGEDGFVIEVSFYNEEVNLDKTWSYQGIISSGKKIS